MNHTTYQTIFQKSFDITNRVIQLFNKRRVPGEAPCKCHHINLSISFIQSFNTDPQFSKHDGNWVAIIKSEQLKDQKIGGVYDRVCQHVIDFLNQTSVSLLESMSANQSDWYPKEEDRASILDLYFEINSGRAADVNSFVV